MPSPSRFLRTAAFRRGVLGSSSGWLAVWGVLTAVRLLRRLFREREVVARLELEPGEGVLIQDTGLPRKAFSRKELRA